MVIDGDGEGVLAAAAAGSIDLDGLPLLLGADVAVERLDEIVARCRHALHRHRLQSKARAPLVLAARERRCHRAGRSAVVLDDVSDARLPVVDDEPASALTVVELRGAKRIWASSYGSMFTLTPEERPTNAFDGDPRTAWRVDLPTATSAPLIGIDLGREVNVNTISLPRPDSATGNATRRHASRVTLDGSRDIDVTLPARARRRVACASRSTASRFTSSRSPSSTRSAPRRRPPASARSRSPASTSRSGRCCPTAVLDLLGANAANAPLAFTLSRERANPAEPVRADPELSMRRILDLPAPLTLTLDGTARVSAGADETLLDRLLGSTRSGVASVRSSEHLAGAITARASSAIDGSTATAWSTPFVGIAGQTWEAALTSPVTLNTLELDIVTDEHHSQPRTITLRVGGNDPVQLSLPALAADGVGIDHARVGAAAAPARRRRSYRSPSTATTLARRPIGTAAAPSTSPLPSPRSGFRLPRPAAAATTIDTGCRNDLVTIDGAPLPVRIKGDSGPTRRDALAVTPCGSALSLAAGRHEIATAVGLDSGIDIDRLVLRSATYDAASAASRRPTAPTVTIDSHHTTSVKATVQTDGAPFWLVLDQSINDGLACRHRRRASRRTASHRLVRQRMVDHARTRRHVRRARALDSATQPRTSR